MLYNLADEYQRKQFLCRSENLIAKGCIVELTEKASRTIRQNKYLHVCLGILALEMGETMRYIKEGLFKKHINPDLFARKNKWGEEYTLSTADISKENMTIAIERFRKFAAEQGVYIPSPEEEDMIRLAEIEINRNNKYL